jgi:hypothetical protein
LADRTAACGGEVILAYATRTLRSFTLVSKWDCLDRWLSVRWLNARVPARRTPTLENGSRDRTVPEALGFSHTQGLRQDSALSRVYDAAPATAAPVLTLTPTCFHASITAFRSALLLPYRFPAFRIVRFANAEKLALAFRF